MKIRMSELRRIIREEIRQTALLEVSAGGPGMSVGKDPMRAVKRGLMSVVTALTIMDVSPDVSRDIRQQIKGIQSKLQDEERKSMSTGQAGTRASPGDRLQKWADSGGSFEP